MLPENCALILNAKDVIIIEDLLLIRRSFLQMGTPFEIFRVNQKII